MRVETARHKIKKPVRTVNIKGGKFRKGYGKFRLYNSTNRRLCRARQDCCLHTHLFGVRGTSKVTWVSVSYPWSYSASSGFTLQGPLCTADEEASWARCVPLGTLQTQISGLGTMIRKNKRVIRTVLIYKSTVARILVFTRGVHPGYKRFHCGNHGACGQSGITYMIVTRSLATFVSTAPILCHGGFA